MVVLLWLMETFSSVMLKTVSKSRNGQYMHLKIGVNTGTGKYESGGGHLLKHSFDEMADGDLVFSLIQFIHEVQKKDGTPYPAETLYSMIINLQVYLATIGKELKFLEDNVSRLFTILWITE